MLKDLLNNIPLLVIMATIILLVIVLFVLLIVQIARKKKQAKNSQPLVGDSTEAPASEEKTEEKTEEKPTEPREEAQPVPTQVTAEEKSEEKQVLTEEKEQEPMKTEEKAPVKKAEPKTTAKAAPKTTAKTAPKAAPKPAEKKPVKAVAAAKVSNSAGKWVLYEEDRGGYGFRLIANNGEEMLRSSSPYATLQSAKSGIKTYQDNIAADRMEVVETKKGNFFVQINNASKRMLATSADYKNRTSAENAAASIKRWAKSAVIVVEDDEK